MAIEAVTIQILLDIQEQEAEGPAVLALTVALVKLEMLEPAEQVLF